MSRRDGAGPADAVMGLGARPTAGACRDGGDWGVVALARVACSRGLAARRAPMPRKERATTMDALIGLDVSLAGTVICVLGEKRKIVTEARVARRRVMIAVTTDAPGSEMTLPSPPRSGSTAPARCAPVNGWAWWSGPSAARRPWLSRSAPSSTAPNPGFAPASSCACSPDMRSGTCAGSSSLYCSTTRRPQAPRPGGVASSHRRRPPGPRWNQVEA